MIHIVQHKAMNFFILQMLQEANEELEEQVKSAQKELEESTSEMNKMTDEYTKLKVHMYNTVGCAK